MYSETVIGHYNYSLGEIPSYYESIVIIIPYPYYYCHLTGSYAMRDLVSNLPSGQQRPAKNLEEDTVVAILNTIHEIVTDSSENARSLIQAQAIEKLVAINRTR